MVTLGTSVNSHFDEDGLRFCGFVDFTQCLAVDFHVMEATQPHDIQRFRVTRMVRFGFGLAAFHTRHPDKPTGFHRSSDKSTGLVSRRAVHDAFATFHRALLHLGH